MTQQVLAAYLGWPQNKVSEAERSWNGKRTREFDAQELIALSLALGVPLNAFFLPPLDDGTDVIYRFRPPGAEDDLGMGDLLAASISDSDAGTSAMNGYRRRLLNAAGHYLSPGWQAEIAQWLKRTGPEVPQEARTGCGQSAPAVAAADDLGQADAALKAADEEEGR
jgi:hypothetical protein